MLLNGVGWLIVLADLEGTPWACFGASCYWSLRENGSRLGLGKLWINKEEDDERGYCDSLIWMEGVDVFWDGRVVVILIYICIGRYKSAWKFGEGESETS